MARSDPSATDTTTTDDTKRSRSVILQQQKTTAPTEWYVMEVTNSTKPKIGAVLHERLVRDLIDEGFTVTIR